MRFFFRKCAATFVAKNDESEGVGFIGVSVQGASSGERDVVMRAERALRLSLRRCVRSGPGDPPFFSVHKVSPFSKFPFSLPFFAPRNNLLLDVDVDDDANDMLRFFFVDVGGTLRPLTSTTSSKSLSELSTSTRSIIRLRRRSLSPSLSNERSMASLAGGGVWDKRG